MDWLTFLSKLAEHLAWPITTLVVVLSFKDTIQKKIKDLVFAKAGSIEAEFEKGLTKVGSDLEKQEPFLAPRTAILNAYEELEEATKSVNLNTEEALKDAISQLEKLRNLIVNTNVDTEPSSETALTYVSLARQARAGVESLTKREKQIMELIVNGQEKRQIADDLGISIKTVEVHRANIMKKANVNTVPELVAWYQKTQ